jgi:predicted nuclease of restriction endonuclease-like (RecB) superfamily
LDPKKDRLSQIVFLNCDALRRELSWTHYSLLMQVEKAEARAFYEAESVNSRWSTRELERQINAMLFERLALSRDKAGVLELSKKNGVKA